MCGIFAILNQNNIDKNITKSFNKVKSRGPEYSHILVDDNKIFGFHRLSINGINNKSNQPFFIDNIILICNGEIYNFKELYNDLNIVPSTDSDCEVIIHMYKEFGIEYTLNRLDGVFAFILYDKTTEEIYIARDPYGVRPLFTLSDYQNNHYFSSTLKGIYDFYLKDITKFKKYDSDITKNYCHYTINQFIPGTYSKFVKHDVLELYQQVKVNKNIKYSSFPCGSLKIKDHSIINNLITSYFCNAVKKRVLGTCERPIGCLLSGGLDSSLVAALVNMYYKGNEKLKTFSIGLNGSEDLKYARIVAEHLQTDHHEIIVTEDDFFNEIENVIENIESYDTTTVRASVGNYLIGKYIKENTDCKVIFNGDGADELMGGYLYFNNAKSDHEFNKECCRLLSDICYFDVLRSDRCISEHGLEPRTPFLDRSWVEFYLTIDKNLRRHTNKSKCEKFLIRNAFSKEYPNILPETILWRTKEAFSDGVSSLQKSWYEIINDKINEKCRNDINLSCKLMELYNDKNLFNNPTTMEQCYYRYFFNKYYKYSDNIIPYFWMPKYTNAKDASARSLDIYKKNNTNVMVIE